MNKTLNQMDRNDLEVAIIENDILPCGTSADCAVLKAMNTEALRAAVQAWIEAGDECRP